MRDLSTTDLEWSNDTAASFEAVSLVDRDSAFDGVFRAQRDLRVEGEVKGTVTCDGTLFIAEGATVAATVDAAHITVAGDLKGEIRCRGRLQILPSGRVRADVTTGSLIIQEGAIYEGQLEMAGIERSAPRALRASPPMNPVNSDPGSGGGQAGNGTTFIRRLGSPEAPWESPREESSGNLVADENNGRDSVS
ncbi:MAG: polymer-forming cytoskeletal protein [Chloroflexi bacterium]|nr:polymer-forming cytoskeletal protein [Chloroflexota bacterium]